MHVDVENAVRESLALVLDLDIAPGDLELDVDLVDGYGLTSLNRVLFLTSACDETGVALSNFTEHDVARMRTLRDVTEAVSRHAALPVPRC
ncbi:MAG TPA: phosphopantetheine-binding protein [Micromonosporaceae bacterium]|nr:phosphopantetheine-binding protein [Micromonosporaceae bacterium]